MMKPLSFGWFVYSQVYLPGTPMEDGEELTFDSSAYKMYHQVCAHSPVVIIVQWCGLIDRLSARVTIVLSAT